MPLFSLKTAPVFTTAISTSSFTQITRADEGGAILEFTLSESEPLLLTGAVFTDCGTRADGAVGCALKVTVPDPSFELAISDENFTSSKSKWENLQMLGLWIIAPSNVLLNHPNISHLLDSYTYTDYHTIELKYLASITSNEVTILTTSLAHLRFGPNSLSTVNTLYIANILEEDIPSCGWNDLPCLTVTHAVEYAGKDIHTFLLLGGSHLAEDNPVFLTMSRTIMGESGTIKPVTQFGSSDSGSLVSSDEEGDPDGVFVIDSNASIVFITLHFTLDSSSVITCSLITAFSGSLVLSDIIIEPEFATKANADSILQLTSPLIYLSPTISAASLSLNAESVKLSNGNGSVVSATLTSSITSFSISECYFTNCYADSGGCIYLSIQSLPTSFSIHTLSSTGCESGNKNEGTVIYFSLSDSSVFYSLHDLLFNSASPSLFNAYSVLIHPLYWVHLTNTTHTFSFSLAYALFSPGSASGASTLLVGKNEDGEVGGLDVDGCGWRDIPCLTVSKAAEHLDGVEIVSLVNGVHSAETKQCVLAESVTVSSSGGVAQKAVSPLIDDPGNAVFATGGGTITFTRIDFFLLSSSDFNAPIFLATSGNLTFNTISIQSYSNVTLNAPLIKFLPISSSQSSLYSILSSNDDLLSSSDDSYASFADSYSELPEDGSPEDPLFDIASSYSSSDSFSEYSSSSSSSPHTPTFTTYLNIEQSTIGNTDDHNTARLIFTVSAIEADACNFLLSSCAFKDIDITTAHSLLSVTLTSFTIDAQANFTSITSRNAGTILHELLSPGESFELSNARFTDCVSYGGLGGALYISITAQTSLSLHDLVFTRCAALCSDTGGGTPSAPACKGNCTSAGGAIFLLVSGVPSNIFFDLLSFIECAACYGRSFCAGIPSTVPEETKKELMTTTLWDPLVNQSSRDEIYTAVLDITGDGDGTGSSSESVTFKITKSVDLVALANGAVLPDEWDSDNIPPLYQFALIASLGGLLILVSFILCTCYCCRNPYAETNDPPMLEEEPHTIIRLLTVVLCIFKFLGLVSLSFLPDGESTMNGNSLFHSKFLRTLFSFGSGILGFFKRSGVYLKFYVSLVIIGATNISGFTLPLSLCTMLALPKQSAINQLITRIFRFQYILLDLVCDLSFEIMMDWIFPVLTCTNYDLTSQQIFLLDLPYIGKESSCVNSTRVALFFLALVMLMVFFIVWAFIFCTYVPDTAHDLNQSSEDTGMEDATRKKDNYYKNIFIIVQIFVQTVMVGMAALLSSVPALVYIIVLICFSVLLATSVHIYARGCRILRRRLNIVFYFTCTLTSFSSLITEVAPDGAFALSILSLIFIVGALLFTAVLVWLGFGCCRKEEMDVFEKFMNTRIFRLFYRGQNAEPVTRTAAMEVEMKHMVVDKDEDEEFTDEDVYGSNDDSNKNDITRHNRKGDASRQELWERLQEFRHYMQANKTIDFLALIDSLQESCSHIISPSNNLSASSSEQLSERIDELHDIYSQHQIDTFKAMLETLRNRHSTSTQATVADPPDSPPTQTQLISSL